MAKQQIGDVTAQERQMLEMLREQQSSSSEFSLQIEHRDGAWDITLSEHVPRMPQPPHRSKTLKGQGTGASFDEAWDNIDPLWA